MDGLAGQTMALNNDDPEYKIKLSASSPADFDVALFGLDKDLKLSNEDYMIFYNQPLSPCHSLELVDHTKNFASFRANLHTLNSQIQHLFLTLTTDSHQPISKISNLHIQLYNKQHLINKFEINTNPFQQQQSILLFRLDKVDGTWILKPTNQGFDGDLADLVKFFGGVIEEENDLTSGNERISQNENHNYDDSHNSLAIEASLSTIEDRQSNESGGELLSREEPVMANHTDTSLVDDINLLQDKAKDFINYINSLHNLNASGVNALAESQSNSPYFDEIYTPFPVVDTIRKLIEGHNNNIVVLTGHAGDGKSTIAFDILETLQKLDTSYQAKTFKEYEYVDKHNLHVLKDMSELSSDTRSHYLSQAFGSKGNWITVSNTGPLLTSVTDALENTNLQGKDNLSKILEILSQDLDILDDAAELERLKLDVDGKNLYIINIAKLDNIEIALQIFQKIIENKAWDLITQNYPTHPITLNRQTIYNHFDEVIDSIRLTYLYLINYERRLTLRQMLAHLASSITMGYTLTDDIEHTILFSDAFFGRVEADIWHKAKNLKLIELLSRLNLGGYTSLEVENIITSHDAFSDIDEPLKSIIQGYIQRDNDSYSSKIKSSLRRILFMYGLNAKSKDAKAHFLGSPSIRKFSNWRLDQESFSDDARSIKKACLTALNLFYSSSQDAKNLNITLKRSDSSVFQIAQLRICSVPESSFSVDYDAVKNLPFFYVKSNKKIRLDLSLPLLDYIDNILANDISDSLNPIYKTQLEKFKLNQIELKAA
ncbi:hypothetical protein MOXK02_21260 [Moraxella sp. K02]